MIEKIVLFELNDDNTSFLDPTTMVGIPKTAGVSDGIQKEIDKILANKDPNYVYLLVNAMGAGEYWGPNVHGDYFSEKDLINSFQTFLNAKVFRQHKNFNPKLGIGDVLYAEYNKDMHRVELIIRVRKDKAPDVVADLEKGKLPDVSMGCRVKYDVCSICGNKAPTRLQYCDHAKNHMNEIMPDGRQVFVYNPNPQFFDISIVRKGADRTAKTLKKIASAPAIEKRAENKKATMDKEVPAQEVKTIEDYNKAVAQDPSSPTAQRYFRFLSAYVDNRPDIDVSMLLSKTKQPWQNVLAALTHLQVPLKTSELDQLIPDELMMLPPGMRIRAMRPRGRIAPLSLQMLGLLPYSVNPLAMSYIAPESKGIVKSGSVSSAALSKLETYLSSILSAPPALAKWLWILFLLMIRKQGKNSDVYQTVNKAVAGANPGESYIDQLMRVARAVQADSMVPIGVHRDAISGFKLSSDEIDFDKLASDLEALPDIEYYSVIEASDEKEIKTAGLMGTVWKTVGKPIAGYAIGAMPAALSKRDIDIKNAYGQNVPAPERFISNTGPYLGAIGAISMYKPGRQLVGKTVGTLTKLLRKRL